MDESGYAAWTQQEFYAHVAAYQDQYRPGEEGYGAVTDFAWSYEPAFDLALLDGGREEWANWYRHELRMLEAEGSGGRYEELATWWAPSPNFAPVIVVEGALGRSFFPWDGSHRVGVSCCADRPTAPAIVGRRLR